MLLEKMTSSEDDFLDLKEDMTDVESFFGNQKSIYDEARNMVDDLEVEKDYLQAERKATDAIDEIKEILDLEKPYSRISELPPLMQDITNVYDQLMVIKKDDVLADIQAAMAEIHQTAKPEQTDTVEKADNAFEEKKNAVAEATKLTSLDAMKVQINSLRQQYLKILVVVEEKPNEKNCTVNRSSIAYSTTLKSKEDVDEYVSEVKDKLEELLDENDVVHII